MSDSELDRLQKDLKASALAVKALERETNRLRAQNARMREALRSIAKEAHDHDQLGHFADDRFNNLENKAWDAILPDKESE